MMTVVSIEEGHHLLSGSGSGEQGIKMSGYEAGGNDGDGFD